MALLEINNLTKRFYGVAAIDKVDLNVNQGEIVGLIGPNGSGKTTLFNCVTRLLSSNGGHILFKGIDITSKEPYEIALLGLARTFQTVRVFPDLSVHENILIAIQQHQEDNILGRLIRTKPVRNFEHQAIHNADNALAFVGLDRYRNEAAANLSYGQRKLLAFAACLAFKPDIYLLDEPAAAVNPTMINRMKEQIRELNKRGATFLIIEHNMEVIMDLSQRIVVLDYGQKIAEGSPSDIQQNKLVLEAYFGRR